MMGLCLAAFATWAWNVGRAALSGDEIFVAQLSKQSAQEILLRLNTDEPHPPLYFLMMHAWRVLTGRPDEMLLRLPSLFAGLLLLSLTYRLGRDLRLGLWGALAAVVALAFIPQLLAHVREARMYVPMAATATFAALVGWRFPRLPRRWAVLAAALASGLALFTQYFNILFIGTLAAWGTAAFRSSARRRWILSQAIALGALFLWLPLMGRGFFNSTNLAQGKTWSFLLPPWETLVRLFEVAVFGYRDYAYVPWALAGGLVLAGVGLAGSLIAGRKTKWLLICLAAAPLAVYAGLCWVRPVYHPKYVLPWLPFAALAAGALAARWRIWGKAIWLALVIFMAWPAWRTLSLPYPTNLTVAYDSWLEPNEREMARGLSTLMGATDIFGLGTPDVRPCFYAQDYLPRDLGCLVLPASPQQTAEALAAQLDQTLRAHRVLWFMQFYNPGWDPNHVAAAALAQKAVPLGTEQLAGRSLDLYASPETILSEAYPVGARLGENARLEGAWLMHGQSLRLVLIWALQPEADGGLKVFVHERDDTGAIAAQADRAWREGAWAYGSHWFTEYTLPLPASLDPTPSAFALGLYDGATLARLPAYGPAGERLPDDAVVIPLAALAQPQLR